MYFLLVHAVIRSANTALSARSIKTQKGFTLVELLAIIAIISLISGLILVSNNKYGGKVLLENLAYDIALSIRQAQVYGISVQRFGTGTFYASYGMHFDSTAGNQTTYSTFADAVTVNGLYDCPTPGSTATCELVQTSTVSGGFKILKLCAPGLSNTAACLDSGVTGVNTVDVVFKRPEPDACISVNGVSDLDGAGRCRNTYLNARIVVQSPRGDTSSVMIESNGQLSVQK